MGCDMGYGYDDELGLGLPMNYDDDDDTGLLSLQNNFVPDNESGFEEIDHNNSNNLPIPPPPDNNPLTKQTDISDFIEELIFTLASKYNGYNNINELKNDLCKDSGYHPEIVAMEFGFGSFETMMKSEKMAKFVKMELVQGEHYYIPRDFSRFTHIRSEQEITRNAAFIGMEKDEHEKLTRAFLPENRDAALEGRRRISEIVYELGGEHKEVLWQEVQKKYREKYEVELAGKELKRFFQRDKATAILQNIFAKEIKLFLSNAPGHFFLKFTMPYKDIIKFYADQKSINQEAENILNGDRRTHTVRNKQATTTPRHKDIHPTHEFVQTNPNVQRYLSENGPSTSAVVQQRAQESIPTTTTNTTSNAASSNAAANPPRTKSKFDIDENDFKPPKRTIANSLDDGDSGGEVQEERTGRQIWTEEEEVPAYQIDQNYAARKEDGAAEKRNENGKSEKKKKYTDCGRHDMTDSSDEGGDDDDNDTLMNGMGRSDVKADPFAAPKSTIIQAYKGPTTLPEISAKFKAPTTHQRAILEHMSQKVAENKAKGHQSGALVGHQNKQQNGASSAAAKSPKFNQNNPILISSSDDDDDGDTIKDGMPTKVDTGTQTADKGTQTALCWYYN